MFYQYLIIPSILFLTLQGLLKTFWENEIPKFLRVSLFAFISLTFWDLIFGNYNSWPDTVHIKVLFVLLLLAIPFVKIRPEVKKLMHYILILNLIIIGIEILLGFSDRYLLGEIGIAKSFSMLFASQGNIQDNNVGMYRKLGEVIYLYRPTGLFGNIHVSTIALLFPFHTYFKAGKLKNAGAIFIFSILAGTIQSIVALIFYFFLQKKLNWKTLLTFGFSVAGIGVIFWRVIRPESFHAEMSMIRIAIEVPFAILQSKVHNIIFGLDLEQVILFLDSQIKTTEGLPSLGLSDSSIARFLLNYGFLKLTLFIVPTLIWVNKKYHQTKDFSVWALYLAVQITVIHYWMYGSYLVYFLLVYTIDQSEINPNLQRTKA